MKHVKVNNADYGEQDTLNIINSGATVAVDSVNNAISVTLADGSGAVSSVNGQTGAVDLSGKYAPSSARVTTPAAFKGAARTNTTQDRVFIGRDSVTGRAYIGNGASGALTMSDTASAASPTYGGAQVKPPGCAVLSDLKKIVRFGAKIYAAYRDTSGTAIGAVASATPGATINTAITFVKEALTLTAGATLEGYSFAASAWASGTQYLYAAEYGDPTGGPSLWRSPDGTTWTSVYGPRADLRHFHAVAADPYVPGHVYLTAGDGVANCIMRSTDSGANWTVIAASKDEQAVQVSFDATYVYFAHDNGGGGASVLRRSDDAIYAAATNVPYMMAVPGGMGGRRVADAVTTSASATLTSATAAFTAADRGRVISLPSAYPAGTYITAITNATTVTMSVVATASLSAQVAYISSDRFTVNTYVGAVDPSTGIYYLVANDNSGRGSRQGLFALDRVGGAFRILDPGEAQDGLMSGTEVFINDGYAWFGYYRFPLLATTT